MDITTTLFKGDDTNY